MAYSDTPLLGEDITQNKVDAAQANPNTPVTPQNAQVATQTQADLTTSDPTNWWVTPWATPEGQLTQWDFNPVEINSQLKTASFTPTLGNPNELENIYWISSSGYKPEDIQKLPWYTTWEWWEIYTKVVNPYLKDPTNNPKFQEFNNDISGIEVDKKQANSWIGMDMNIWYKLSETLDLAQQLWHAFTKRNADLDKHWEWQKFVDAYNTVQSMMKSIPPDATYEQINQIMQKSIADLKISMIPVADKAKWIEFAKFGANTTVWDMYQDFLNKMNKFEQLYKADGTRLKELTNNFKSSLERFNVEYKKLTDQPSVNAKNKLRDNPAYQDFLKTIIKQRPELKSRIESNLKETVITQFEKDLIKNQFVWGYASELFSARAAAMKQFWNTASAWFKDFDELIKIKDLPFETREDDLLAWIDFSWTDYSKFGWSYNFSLGNNASNFLPSGNVNSGWQSKLPEYTNSKITWNFKPTYG